MEVPTKYTIDLCQKYDIKMKNNMYNLVDVVQNIVKSKNPYDYVQKFKDKKKICKGYYIDKKSLISIVEKCRSDVAKHAR